MSTTKYQMQAKSSADGQLYSWLANLPDWAAAGYTTAGHPGTAQDITLAGGGIDNAVDTTPDGAMTFDDGSFVVFDDGSYAVTT